MTIHKIPQFSLKGVMTFHLEIN